MCLKKILLLTLLLLSFLYAEIRVRGGEVASKEQLLYGRYEVRMQTAQGSGILSTFFTFESDGWIPNSGNPWREIDIEVLGRYTERFQTNIITGTAESRTTSEYFAKVKSNPATGYHTYGIEWTPEYISFLFDGEVMRKTESTDSKNQVVDCRDIPQSYRFNFWANAISSWVGTFNDTILPKYQFVNWIKYYKYSTANKSFTLDWTDDFNTFNSSKWSKSTHTIEEFTLFSASNILVKDGTLILAMTDMSGNGLSNISVPQDGQTKVSNNLPAKGKKKLNLSYFNNKIDCKLESLTDRNISYEISDMCGRIITRSKLSPNGKKSFSIILDDIFTYNGMYIFRLKTNSGIFSQTFIVSK
jgi:hypothetical protein